MYVCTLSMYAMLQHILAPAYTGKWLLSQPKYLIHFSIKKSREAVIASCKVCFLPALCEWLNVGLAECLSVRMYFCWFKKIDVLKIQVEDLLHGIFYRMKLNLPRLCNLSKRKLSYGNHTGAPVEYAFHIMGWVTSTGLARFYSLLYSIFR